MRSQNDGGLLLWQGQTGKCGTQVFKPCPSIGQPKGARASGIPVNNYRGRGRMPSKRAVPPKVRSSRKCARSQCDESEVPRGVREIRKKGRNTTRSTA